MYETRGTNFWDTLYCGLQWGNRRFTEGCKGLADVTRGKRVRGEYRGLHGFTRGYRRLEEVIGGYKSLKRVTGGCKGLQRVTRDFMGLQEDTRGFKRLQVVIQGATEVDKG